MQIEVGKTYMSGGCEVTITANLGDNYVGKRNGVFCWWSRGGFFGSMINQPEYRVPNLTERPERTMVFDGLLAPSDSSVKLFNNMREAGDMIARLRIHREMDGSYYIETQPASGNAVIHNNELIGKPTQLKSTC